MSNTVIDLRPRPTRPLLHRRAAVVNAADCPECGMEAGAVCVGVTRRSSGLRLPRQSPHMGRWNEARRVLGHPV